MYVCIYMYMCACDTYAMCTLATKKEITRKKNDIYICIYIYIYIYVCVYIYMYVCV